MDIVDSSSVLKDIWIMCLLKDFGNKSKMSRILVLPAVILIFVDRKGEKANSGKAISCFK